jgi:hypothetical protein
MGRRVLITDPRFTSSDRQQLAAEILNYVDEAVRTEHKNAHEWHHVGNPEFFNGHRRFIAKLETALKARGLDRFVPLPKWDPATTIPPELRGVKLLPEVISRGLGQIDNPSPNLPTPANLADLSRFPTVAALSADFELQSWHGVVHGRIGGAMSDPHVSPCATVFWLWHAFIDDVYEDWRRLHGFRLQTGTALHETGDDFDFALAADSNLFAIKKQGGDTTQLHVLSADSNYQSFSLQTETNLHPTDGSWAFAVTSERNLFGIKKRATDTRSTEVHVVDLLTL